MIKNNLHDTKLLDCTLRDGGYYNAWNFSLPLIHAYYKAMTSLPVDMVEIGLRMLPDANGEFKGGCAYCTDEFIASLSLPETGPPIAVMVNAADLLKHSVSVENAIDDFFGKASLSPVKLVRVAVHVNKVRETLPAIIRLNELGYKTTINLMQIAGLSANQISELAKICSDYPIDVLYFADSLGSMDSEDINYTVEAFREHWSGELGFHAHNNMESALANCNRAMELGVTWIDSTILGMGRGPGNAKTECLSIEFETKFNRKMNYIPLYDLMNKYFIPLQKKYNWGPNAYYHMAGKYGIHPTYIQEMTFDTRYNNADILAAIEHLKQNNGKNYSIDNLEATRNFYSGKPDGLWNPESLLKDKEILLLGTGPGVKEHRLAIEAFVKKQSPFVIALNTQSHINSELIDIRIACHPFRLLADCEEHVSLPQPLITPLHMLPCDVQKELSVKSIYDYGMTFKENTFEFFPTYSVLPNSMVISYALAVIAQGKAKHIYLAGFDGYGEDDPRNNEMNELLKLYNSLDSAVPLTSITPTRYKINSRSVYEISYNSQ